MAKQNQFKDLISKQYDRIIALAVLLGLFTSLYYLVSSGVQLRNQEEAKNIQGSASTPRNKEAQAIDMDTLTQALADATDPVKGKRTLVNRTDAADADLFTPASKILCLKCMQPIPLGLDACVTPGCTAVFKVKEIDYSLSDQDDDGMNNAYEAKYGFDPKDPKDADADADKDGFSNLEECQAKTNPRDPLDHPLYATRMTLVEIAEKKLPFVFINTSLDGWADKEQTKLKYKADFKVNVGSEDDPKYVNITAKVGSEIATVQRVYDPLIKATKTVVSNKTGFKVISITKNEDRTIQVVLRDGQDALATKQDARSTPRVVSDASVTVQNITSGKKATLQIFDKRNPVKPAPPSLDPEAIVTSPDVKNGDKQSLVLGQSLTIKDELYVVKSIKKGDNSLVFDVYMVKNGKKGPQKGVFELK